MNRKHLGRLAMLAVCCVGGVLINNGTANAGVHWSRHYTICSDVLAAGGG